MRKLALSLVVSLVVGLLFSESQMCYAKTKEPEDIATEQLDTIYKAHLYYVGILGLACEQCKIPARGKNRGAYGNVVFAHGGGGVLSYDVTFSIDDYPNGLPDNVVIPIKDSANRPVLDKDGNPTFIIKDPNVTVDRVGYSDYGKKPGPKSFWMMVRDDRENKKTGKMETYAKWLIVNGHLHTFDWECGDSKIKSKYNPKYIEYKMGGHAWPGLEQWPDHVIYGEDMEDIGNATFSNMSSVYEFWFGGDKVEEIGEFAFYDNNSLPEFILDNNVKRIKKEAFVLGPNLEKFTLNKDNSSLIYIGNRAFLNTPLKELVCPQKLKNIGIASFKGCSKMDRIDWNKVDMEIGEYAFENCQSLGYEIVNYIPKNVKLKGKYCFRNCK